MSALKLSANFFAVRDTKTINCFKDDHQITQI
jgi:hypothetical protein